MTDKNARPTPHLSKTLFIKGLQCHKYLWFEKRQPELRDAVSDFQEAIFRSGSDVGMRARDLFPGGVDIPYEGLTHAEQIERTTRAIASGATTLYEAAFSHDGIFIKADILHRTGEAWNLYEVKSSTEIKDTYLNDVAVQYYVMTGGGIPVRQVYLVYINNQYVRQGAIDVHGLFTIEDTTRDAVDRAAGIPQEAAAMRTMLQGDCPVIDIGPHCSDPYDCQFMGTCWKHIPENSVFSLRGKGIDKFELYRQGIIGMEDIPHAVLNSKQLLQVEGTLHKKDSVDIGAIRDFLGTLRYPLCFLDFETTFMSPVPLYDGTRPYQQIPFQFSAHVIQHAGARMQHYEFLAEQGHDPRRQFMEKLADAVPEQACVVVYNKGFEARILDYLREWFPEYGISISAIIAHMVDLMEPFRRRDVYLWQMQGSYSIKAVLPALVPELSYDALVISNGEMASSAWLALAQETDPGKIETVRKQLLDYCCLDTLAMVRIYEKLQDMAQPG